MSLTMLQLRLFYLLRNSKRVAMLLWLTNKCYSLHKYGGCYADVVVMSYVENLFLYAGEIPLLLVRLVKRVTKTLPYLTKMSNTEYT